MKLLFFRKEGNLMKDKLQNVLLSISAKVESNKYRCLFHLLLLDHLEVC